VEEKIYEWKSNDHIIQFLEQVRLDLLQNNQASLVAINVTLERNYGFIIATKNNLPPKDHDFFIEFLRFQLTEFGYRVNRELGTEILLQASVKSRVHGKQLFGTIKIINKGFELRILVTPYVDKGYNKAMLRKDLIDVLFT
jgi:hypothetical protein